MEATEIEVNGVYAYLRHGSTKVPHEPLKVTVLEGASGGMVKVLRRHPDTGESEVHVATRELVGGWFDEPEERFAGQHLAAIRDSRAQGQAFTWSDVARIRYDLVGRQRALATRINALGVARGPVHYAGAGGESGGVRETSLLLNYDELETLISRAERVPA
jgi:hypothetical protein